MPKYMIQATYTAEGLKGLTKDGGSKRRAVVEQAMKAVGGSLESFYFAFGSTDAYIVVDVPDVVSGVAVGMTVGATGTVHCTTVPLITCEEIDQAAKKQIPYRAPGA
jgi:uncharacterized protein with GYD domain